MVAVVDHQRRLAAVDADALSNCRSACWLQRGRPSNRATRPCRAPLPALGHHARGHRRGEHDVVVEVVEHRLDIVSVPGPHPPVRIAVRVGELAMTVSLSRSPRTRTGAFVRTSVNDSGCRRAVATSNLPRPGVIADLWPSGWPRRSASPWQRSGSSSRSSGQTAHCCAGVQRRRTADIEEVSQLERMAGTERERQRAATAPALERRGR